MVGPYSHNNEVIMGAPSLPKPLKPPKRADALKAQLEAIRFADTERRLMASSGRRGQFLTLGGRSRQGRTSLLGL